ncbi:MAG: dephospho-CoA kinase [Dehalococcoidales bacterium]|nr:MAG: dephospho-CoA kinase [Dehalococcoidales bacterium]
MKVIGLTGGIGSGKSTVSQVLAELGAMVIDADTVGHQAYQPGTETWKDVVAAFGQEVVAADGSIDRKKLGAIVFGEAGALERLNRIVHPRMYDMMAEQIEEYRRQEVKVVVLDAAILIEANWTPLVDEVWLTVASEPIVVQRARERTGLPEEQIRSRIRSQLSNEERMKHSSVVINNDGSLDQLRTKVMELWEGLQHSNN